MLRRIIKDDFHGVKLYLFIFLDKCNCLCSIYFCKLLPRISGEPLVSGLFHSLAYYRCHGVVIKVLFYERCVHIPGLAKPRGARELGLNKLQLFFNSDRVIWKCVQLLVEVTKQKWKPVQDARQRIQVLHLVLRRCP